MDGRHRGDSSSLMRQTLPIYYALVLAMLTFFFIQILLRLEHVLLILFISLLFAATVARPAEKLERLRIPSLAAALIVYLAGFGVLLVLGWYVLPPLFGQIAELSGDLPDYVSRFEGLRARYEELQAEYPTLEAFDSQVEGLAGRIASGVGNRLAELPTTLFSLLYDAISVFFISLLLVTTRSRLLEFTLSMVAPEHRDTTRKVLTKMWVRVGFYLRAKLIVMVIVGVLMYGALLLIGVDFALLLAIVVALGQLIPRIGPWLARIPLLSLAALQGLPTLALVFTASIVIENFKGYVISPIIEGDQLDIHPLLVFISILVGGSLLGLPGAFIAVPAAAMIQVVFEEVIIPWRKRQIGEDAPVPAKTST